MSEALEDRKATGREKVALARAFIDISEKSGFDPLETMAVLTTALVMIARRQGQVTDPEKRAYFLNASTEALSAGLERAAERTRS